MRELPRALVLPRHDGSLGRPSQLRISVKYPRRFARSRPESRGTGSSLVSTFNAQSRGIITGTPIQPTHQMIRINFLSIPRRRDMKG